MSPVISVAYGSSWAISGCCSANALTRSMRNMPCTIGFSQTSVPSWSKTAIRSGTGTNVSLPCRETFCTKSRIDCLVGPSFQLGSGSSFTDGCSDVGVLVAADCEPHEAQAGEPAVAAAIAATFGLEGAAGERPNQITAAVSAARAATGRAKPAPNCGGSRWISRSRDGSCWSWMVMDCSFSVSVNEGRHPPLCEGRPQAAAAGPHFHSTFQSTFRHKLHQVVGPGYTQALFSSAFPFSFVATNRNP